MNFFSPESEAPTSAIEIVMVPFFFLILGIFVYTAANRFRDNEGKNPKWLPVVWVSLGLAILFGLQRYAYMSDILYAQTLVTGRIRYSHHAGLFLPLLTTIIIVIREVVRKRNEAERLY